MASRTHTRKLVASSSAYIDPLNADSTVSYKVLVSDSVWGSVLLTDCTRKIEWYFGVDDSIEKVDRAVAMLQEFKAAYLAAKKKRKAK
jgi:Iap family predicted aminopeptidase